MKSYLKLIRVHHYIKNLLVFVALICSGQFFCLDKFLLCTVAFVTFCLVSSVVYIINDIRDKEKDARHPTKCKRPIAAGEISVKAALILASIFVLIAVICNYQVFHVTSTMLLALYFALNLGYSFGLKNIPVLDVSILVAGFLIRIIYGAIITEITISNWLYLTVIAITFYLALGKRRNELMQCRELETRPVLNSYPIGFLDKNMVVCLTLANVFYALWSMDKKTMSFYGNERLIFTVPVVLLITMKYSLNIERGMDGDPVEVLLHDKGLLVLCVLYMVVMFVVLYL